MKLFLLTALAVVLTLNAQAQTGKGSSRKATRSVASSSKVTHEILTNLTGGVLSSEKTSKSGEAGTTLAVSGSYLRYWKDNMQWGVEGGIQMLPKSRTNSGSSETLFDVAGVGVYNLTSDLENSIFAKAGVGLYATPKDSGNGYENKLGLFFGVGKRFMWMDNVAYSPELRIVKVGDIDLGIRIHVLNFSIMW